MADMTLAPLVLLPASAYSSSQSGLGTPVVLKVVPRGAAVQLGVTTAPSTSFATATLDVYLQHSVDYLLAGAASSNFAATWDDFLHFTQVASGTAGVAALIAGWQGLSAPSSSVAIHASTDGSLAAGQIRNGPTGPAWRVRYALANGPAAGASSAFTFSVRAQVYQ